MSSISSQQALYILTGSEGAKDNLVTLAVPDKILGSSTMLFPKRRFVLFIFYKKSPEIIHYRQY